MFDRMTALPRRSKQVIVMALDAAVALATMWLAFCLRLGTTSVDWTPEQGVMFLLAPALALPIFVRCGLYRAIFRYSGFGATAAITRAVTIYTLAFSSIVLLLSLPTVPRTIAVIQPMLFAWSILAMRSLGHLTLADGRRADAPPRERLLIYGAGVTGIQTAGGLRTTGKYQIMGFLDDDSRKVGREILGMRVFGRGEVEAMLQARRVDSVLLALPRISRGSRNAILDWLRPYALHVRSVPSIVEIATGKVTLSDLRDLDVEDVLGREPVSSDGVAIERDIAGRVVAVTGAGGSIGSELCRQLLRAQPSKLLLIEASEYALYTIHKELAGLCEVLEIEVALVPLLCNVQHARRVDDIFATWHPSTVYHAAAYKHVPLVEHNPSEGVANNVLGTLNVAQAAVKARATRLVLVSTDKAVRPTNVMGASKRLAEITLQAMAAESWLPLGENASVVPNTTIMTMVRFGNVLGSSGSVVPLFRSQLAAGGPLTVTHKDVIRYFMTIPEAVQLVLQAGAMAKGGEVFLLDMGEPVRIFDMARRIIELSGSTVRDEDNPEGDIEIQVTGLRPGEKLYEELLIDGDAKPTEHPRILQARERMWPWLPLRRDLHALREALASGDSAFITGILTRYVDGYAATGEVQDWVDMERATRSMLPEPMVGNYHG